MQFTGVGRSRVVRLGAGLSRFPARTVGIRMYSRVDCVIQAVRREDEFGWRTAIQEEERERT